MNTFQWEEAFPELEVISCWTDAQASLWMKALQTKSGKIKIQPKGLLSTEGLVTIPTLHGNSIAYTSHFFEFIHLENHQIYLAHELEIYNRYEVVITTAGGLYRYKTKDVVQVMDMVPYPILGFEGRSGVVSDLVGEKIDQFAVQKIFYDILQKYTHFNALLLQPILMDNEAYYRLYLFSDYPLPVQDILEEVNDRLKENPFYRQAIDLRQLGPIQAWPYPTNMLNTFAATFSKKYGIKDGDAKLPVLLPISINFNNDKHHSL